MSVYLINGDGNPKVTASQDADWYGAMTGEKTAILPMNDSFEYSILSNNLISIGSGVLVTREGRRVQIDNNDSIEIAIPSGAVGSNSYYIVGFRLYIDTDGTQKAEGFCQTMTSATETITETAFKEGSSTVYVSLYRITKVGVDIDSTDLLLPIFVGLVDKANQVSICSDIETVNSSASKSYSIGKYFWNTLTNKLRRVTSAISSGSTITDSNSTETTVADELSRINTDLSDKFTDYTVLAEITATGNVALSDNLSNYKYLVANLWLNGSGYLGGEMLEMGLFRSVITSATQRMLVDRKYDVNYECDFYKVDDTHLYCHYYQNISKCIIYGVN